MRPPSYLSSFYLSPPLYFFGRMTITATKQQQARRYAELYSHYHGRGYGTPVNPWLGHRTMGGRHDEHFWDEFESGRRGAYLSAHEVQQQSRADAFFRLQILQMILSQRGRDDDEDDDEDDEEEDEDELELLTQQAAFYSAEGACGQQRGSVSQYQRT
jgi:hypothetical protein